MENETFRYTYSGKERTEIEEIRKKYLPREENKMERLRALDSIPYKKAQAWSIGLGTVGALVLGTGMSFGMTDLGERLGAHRESAMLIGVAVGVVGLVLVALAYPVYNRILKKERQRVAPEVLRLTEELLKSSGDK